MNRQKVWFGAEARNFEATATGVRWEAVIFSSEFNRNKAYFDLNKMRRWVNKLTKVLLNDDHNEKYFSITTDQIESIEIVSDDSGVTEVYAVVVSTNPKKVADPTIVTGFSIEVMVDAKNVISNENGEYYIDFEWVGMAYLTGQLAGSGDTRLLSMRTFADAQNNTTMTEDQIKVLLAEQADQLKQTFKAETDEIKADFASQMEQLISSNQVKTEGTCSWVDDGVTYTEKWSDLYTSAVTAIGSESPSAEDIMDYMAKKFGIKKFQTEGDDTDGNDEDQGKDDDGNDNEEENELKKIEQSLTHANKLKTQMKQFNGQEELSGHQNEPEKTADTAKVVSGFLAKFKKKL
jgi:hypothetical protein